MKDKAPVLDASRAICDGGPCADAQFPMPLLSPPDLKQQLRAAGFEIYRTKPEQVHLAERVRDNLIMDSGVAALLSVDSQEMAVQVTVRAQASHFPGADDEQIWTHARQLAQEFIERGYQEHDRRAADLQDPSDPEKSLDTSHEILLRLVVTDVPILMDELRAALERKRSTGDE